jgi:hypothetical protein
MALTAADITALTTMAMAGSDADLSPADRRNRVLTGGFVAGETRTFLGGVSCVILGPGRGRNTLLVAYEEGGAKCIRTFFVSQVR